jgi:hypothetical protein
VVLEVDKVSTDVEVESSCDTEDDSAEAVEVAVEVETLVLEVLELLDE